MSGTGSEPGRALVAMPPERPVEPLAPRPALEDVIVELKRELAQRNKHYPRWVRDGRLPQGVADWRVACLVEGLRLLKLRDQPDLAL